MLSPFLAGFHRSCHVMIGSGCPSLAESGTLQSLGHMGAMCACLKMSFFWLYPDSMVVYPPFNHLVFFWLEDDTDLMVIYGISLEES